MSITNLDRSFYLNGRINEPSYQCKSGFEQEKLFVKQRDLNQLRYQQQLQDALFKKEPSIPSEVLRKKKVKELPLKPEKDLSAFPLTNCPFSTTIAWNK